MNDDFSRILGVDYGSVRIGLALSDPLRIIAQGLKTIQNTTHAWKEIAAIVEEHNVSCIVVGKPLNLSGTDSAKSAEVDEFVKKLRQETAADIVMVDERFTSVMAQKSIIQMGARKKQRQNKGKIDEVASAILLQGYLDSLKR
ncbi:MAG: Holliday junction resolvase RuvX [Bacteroidota bacterium]